MFGDKYDVAEVMLSAISRGMIPLKWEGTWPEGYLIAYVPQEIQGQISIIAPGQEVPKRSPIKDVINLDRGDYLNEWKKLAETPLEPARLAQHLSVFCHTPEEKTAVVRIAERLISASINGANLVLVFSGIVDAEITVHMGPPAEHYEADMPRDLRLFLQLHNGIQAVDQYGMAMPLVGHKYINGDFAEVDWDLWWESDPQDQDDVLANKPWVPIGDLSDIWLYRPDPTRYAFVRMEHEIGGMSKPLDYGPGGVLIRLLSGILLADYMGLYDDNAY